MKNRMLYLLSFTLTVLLLSLPRAHADALQGKTVKICDDGAEWPPFIYYQRDNGNKTKDVVGYSVDVISDILGKVGAKFTVKLAPWKRCLSDLEKGKYDMVLNASYNDERAGYAYFSKPFYSLTPSYIYMKAKYPQGLKVSSAKELVNYKVCGLRGYNYKDFGIESKDINTNTKDFNAVLKKLETGRCEVVLARIEVLLGFAKTGEKLITDGMTYASIPGAKKSDFYMLISKKSKLADPLKADVDKGIMRLEESGELQQMKDKFLK
ncbi:substrate-binding periplasmic protein [Dongshaea marina]|uniref:substrate-binding periplasmic protein n=1 Tax=Dongshaea marina TaxID=2047966 RepID=UPI000D3ED423|nr:transporter substrate-binding domain-containing protein [Dongshaea marina]